VGKSLKGASAKCEQNAISQPLGVSKKRNNNVCEKEYEKGQMPVRRNVSNKEGRENERGETGNERSLMLTVKSVEINSSLQAETKSER